MINYKSENERSRHRVLTNDSLWYTRCLAIVSLQHKRLSAVERKHLGKGHLVEATEDFGRAADKQASTVNTSGVWSLLFIANSMRFLR